MKKEFSRRSFIEKSAALALTTLPTLGLASTSSFKNQHLADTTSFVKEDGFKTYIRLMGSLEPATIYSWFSGHLWGIVPGEAPKPLTTLQGLAKSNWNKEGENIVKESFDLGFFGDLETGQVLQEWKNPYTQEIVQPFHFMYGGGSTTVFTPNGKKSGGKIIPYATNWMHSGDQVWLDEYGSASFENPLQPEQWPKASAGKQMHFGSSTTYVAQAASLFNTAKATCGHTFFWTAVNSWEPWLQMGQRDGYVMWRATGRKNFDLDEIPKTMKAYVAKVQPNYFEALQPWKGRRSTYESYKASRKS